MDHYREQPNLDNSKNPENLMQPESLAELLRLREQYDAQFATLEALGLITSLTDGRQGIQFDDQEYALPTFGQVEALIESQRELIELKFKQGFTNLEIVPLMPLVELVAAVRSLIITQVRNPGQTLLAPKVHASDPDEPVRLHPTDQPVELEHEFRTADQKDQLVYYPTSLTEPNVDSTKPGMYGGLTRLELIEYQKQTQPATAGFLIQLTEPLVHLPGEGRGKNLGGRQQLETNTSSLSTLNLLNTEPYRGEKGDIIQASLVRLAKSILANRQVVDDIQDPMGFGKGNLLFGNFLIQYQRIAAAYFSRSRGIECIQNREFKPTTEGPTYGFRTGVPLNLPKSSNTES